MCQIFKNKTKIKVNAEDYKFDVVAVTYAITPYTDIKDTYVVQPVLKT